MAVKGKVRKTIDYPFLAIPKAFIAIPAACFGLIYTISKDVVRYERYKNQPKNFFYDPKKPTPNTGDFPNGEPEKITYKFLKKMSDFVERK